ncbi:unnamed protein product [Chrysoparadoxa australica]
MGGPMQEILPSPAVSNRKSGVGWLKGKIRGRSHNDLKAELSLSTSGKSLDASTRSSFSERNRARFSLPFFDSSTRGWKRDGLDDSSVSNALNDSPSLYDHEMDDTRSPSVSGSGRDVAADWRVTHQRKFRCV